MDAPKDSKIASKHDLVQKYHFIKEKDVHDMLFKKPPIILLKRRIHDDVMYNTATFCYDPPNMTLDRYFSCGWYVKKVVMHEYGSIAESPFYAGVYLEFLGEKACAINIKEYIWPGNLPECKRSDCPHVIRKNSSAIYDEKRQCYPLHNRCKGTIMY